LALKYDTFRFYRAMHCSAKRGITTYVIMVLQYLNVTNRHTDGRTNGIDLLLHNRARRRLVASRRKNYQQKEFREPTL